MSYKRMTKVNSTHTIDDALKRLAELEDKIEQGTLIFKENEDEKLY